SALGRSFNTAIGTLGAADEGGTTKQIEVGVDVDALKNADLSAKGNQGELRRSHPVDRAELLTEVLAQVDARQLVVDTRSTVRLCLIDARLIHLLNALGQPCVELERIQADRTPAADRQPVRQVVVQTRTHQHQPLVLVEQSERHRGGDFETSLSI